jgi:hypothetical protein
LRTGCVTVDSCPAQRTSPSGHRPADIADIALCSRPLDPADFHCLLCSRVPSHAMQCMRVRCVRHAACESRGAYAWPLSTCTAVHINRLHSCGVTHVSQLSGAHPADCVQNQHTRAAARHTPNSQVAHSADAVHKRIVGRPTVVNRVMVVMN